MAWPAMAVPPAHPEEGQPVPKADAPRQPPFVSGFALLSLTCALQVVHGTRFLAGRPVTREGSLFAAVLAAGLAWRAGADRLPRRRVLLAGLLAAMAATVAATIAVAGAFDDVSGDGRFYHQEGVIALS